jgi:heat shock protein HslJ
MSTEHDDPIEQRLRAAGARWREVHETSARADFGALAERSTADERRGAGPGASTGSTEIPLVPIAKPARRKGKGRWIVAGLTAAATVAAVLVAVAITRPGSDGGGRHAGSVARGTTAEAVGLAGIGWELIQLRDGAGRAVQPIGGGSVSFAGETMKGRDGCSQFFGNVAIHPGLLAIDTVGRTAMGCIEPAGIDETINLVHAVLEGEVHYSLAGDTLTLTRAGVGTLVYRGASQSAPVTDPKVLTGTQWQLDTISSGTGSDGTASGSSEYAKVTLTFDKGRIEGNDGCNGFGGDVTIGQGTMSIGGLLGTMMACPNSPDQQVRAVLTGAVTWSVTGDKLTITKDGVGALIYVRAGVRQHQPITDPSLLQDTHWQLATISTETASGGSGSGSPEYAKVTLTFDRGARVSGNDGCNGFGADVALAAGSMEVSGMVRDTKACVDAPDYAPSVRKVLSDGVIGWQIADGRLELARYGMVLTFVKIGANGN